LRSETRVSALLNLIQYSVKNLRQSKKGRKRNKRETNRKGRGQMIPICRWYDPIRKGN
jgi:hypothetical protein